MHRSIERRSTIGRCSFLLAMLIAGVASGGDEFPYVGYIADRNAAAASGPGTKYYTTQQLAAGTEVEVFARDEATGFLAIRPPVGSFSWAPAEHVQLTDDPSIGVVTTATHAWIGTTAENVRTHKFQVRLPVGERLEILGEREVETDSGVQTWLKIAPPAGEFRWLPGRSVTQTPPRDLPQRIRMPEVDATEADGETWAADQGPRRRAAPAIGLNDLQNLDENETDDVRFAQYTRATARPATSPVGDGFVPRKPRTLAAGAVIGASGIEAPSASPAPASSIGRTNEREDRASRRSDLADRTATRSAVSPATASAPRSSFSPSSAPVERTSGGIIESAIVARELEAIDLDLSLMLSQPKDSWSLSVIRRRIDDLVQHGESASDRGQARLLAEKLDKIATAFNVSTDGPTTATATGYAAVAQEAASPNYDAQGWLKPVLSRNRHTAPYAVVDTDGKPIAFVTPSPGFRIEQYVNKQVGVYGRRGYIESLQSQHVLAERVIDLDRRVR